jgi:hypothetical protein
MRALFVSTAMRAFSVHGSQVAVDSETFKLISAKSNEQGKTIPHAASEMIKKAISV